MYIFKIVEMLVCVYKRFGWLSLLSTKNGIFNRIVCIFLASEDQKVTFGFTYY